MSRQTFRAFVGDWSDGGQDPDWVHLDQHDLSWDQARDAILAMLKAYEDDTCEDCRTAAAEATAKLKQAEPGPFEDQVDGDDYLIMLENSAS